MILNCCSLLHMKGLLFLENKICKEGLLNAYFAQDNSSLVSEGNLIFVGVSLLFPKK